MSRDNYEDPRINELNTIIENAQEDIQYFNARSSRDAGVFETFEDFEQFIAESNNVILNLKMQLTKHEMLRIELVKKIQLLFKENSDALMQWYATEDYENIELRTKYNEFFQDRLIDIENLKLEYMPQNLVLMSKKFKEAIGALTSAKEIGMKKYEEQTNLLDRFYIIFDEETPRAEEPFFSSRNGM